jgi:predicted TIM-barrel fold metal-dependent hydrolase
MIIDTHQHVFWHKRDDKGLIADMDEHGIDVAWLLSWEIHPTEDQKSYHSVLNPLHFRADGTHAGIPLSDLLLAKQRYPNRFIVGYCPHPLYPGACAAFESAYNIWGVRILAEWKFQIPFDDPRCIELFRTAGRLKCPVVLHLDIPWIDDGKGTGNKVYQKVWYGGTVDNLERALIACPETTFIGHAPGFWREISGDADSCPSTYPSGPVTPGGKLYNLFDKYPNLWADLSAGSGNTAIKRDPEHGKKFVERYQDRLLFARDYYGGDLHQTLTSFNLSESVKKKLYSENALRLIPLGK